MKSFFIGIFLLSTALAKESSDLDKGWIDASGFLFNDAYSFFSSKNPDDPTVQLGMASTLLNIQPRTSQNIQKAEAILLNISRTQPPDSTVARLARFLEARILESYRTPPDLPAAMDHYRALLEAKTGLPLIEIAGSRLVIITTFESASHEDNLQALKKLEGIQEQIVTPEGLREFHLSMGSGILENRGDPTTALEHWIAADRIGFRRKENSISIWLNIARISQDIQRYDLAAIYYRKFLEAFPRDPRVHTVKARLATVENHGQNP